YFIWVPDKPVIDRAKCLCSCFDTIFRGRYEWPPSAYKHMYFNCTSNTLRMWFIVLLGVLGFYESLRYLLPLLWRGKSRLQMILLFLASLYPHYYGWWGLINYLNEDYYPQWYHQIFFSVTEIASTAMVIHLCNQDNRVESWKLLLIFDINMMHVIVSGFDQFIVNVIFHKGQHFEAVRDFGLMIPDVFHVLVAFFEMTTLAERKSISVFKLFYKEEIFMSLVVIILFSLLGKNI
ncbi:hypothetical protein CAPTEDRAFT_102797, partial [Capitella teleta]